MKRIIILSIRAWLIVLLAQPASAQSNLSNQSEVQDFYSSPNPFFSFNEDEDIIDITSPHISHLKIYVDTSGIEASGIRKIYTTMLGKNLVWSGVFDVVDAPEKADYIIVAYQGFFSDYFVEFKNFELKGALKEKLVYEAKDAIATEKQVISLVNKIVELLTGRPSTLGARLLYLEKKLGESSKNIVLSDTHFFDKKTLVANGRLNFSPRVSPSGERFSFITLSPNGYVVNIYEMSDGSIRQLTKVYDLITGGSWSPDEKSIAFTISVNGNSDIFIFDAKSGERLNQLTSLSSIENSPTISPKGEIAFISDRSGSPQIYLYAGSENSMNRLTFKGKYNTEPRWHPIDNMLVFTSYISGALEVMLYNIDSKETNRITREGISSEQPTWSPDGRRLSFSKEFSSQPKIFMMNLDGSYLKRLTYSGNDIIESDPEWFSK